MISDGRAVEFDSNDNFTLDNMHDLNDNYYCGSTAQYVSCKVYNWSKANWASLENFFNSFDWKLCFNLCTSSDDFINCFYSVLWHAINLFVPASHSKSNPKNKRKRFQKYIRKKYTLKSILWRKYKKKKTLASKMKYRKAAQTCKSLLHVHEANTEKNILSANDLGKFYRYINSKLSCKSGIAPLTTSTGNYVFDNHRKANLLNDYFASVGVEDNGTIPNLQPVDINNALSSVNFTPNRLFNIMRKLKNSLASGPDGFPPMFFKHLASCLSNPLSALFKNIFEYETIPSIWKHAYVTPVFKKGKSSLVQNYRPISLISVICKIFESSIKIDLVNFLAANNLITSDQHGFMAKRSTCTNLMETLNHWTLTMRDGYYTRVAYIDFARAFDSVCHSKLIYKLSGLGISGSLLAVLSSYLYEKTH